MINKNDDFSTGADKLKDLDNEYFGEGFENFYTEKILPFLHSLSLHETAYHNWKRFTLITGIGAFAIFLMAYLAPFYGGNLLAGTLLAICFVGVFFSAKYSDDYLDNFKEKIIGQIIECIHPGSVYKPMGFISHKEYKASSLYRQRYTHFDGDDFWQSEYDGIAFHCSEIVTRLQYATGTEVIFQGLFLTVDIKLNLSGGTYIWARGNAQLPDSIADEHYRMFPLPKVYKYNTGHLGFNALYSVYATNTSETSLLLTSSMMDHMVEIRQKLKKEIVYSFIGSRCYVAVPFDENLLEPSGQGVQDKEAIRDYFYTILLVFNIIKKLGLNQLG